MATITQQQLEDAAADAAALALIVNGTATENGDGTVPTRTGGDRRTLAKLEADFVEVIEAQGVQEETATAAAEAAEGHAAVAQAAANQAIALLFSRFGLPGLTVDFISNTSVRLADGELINGTAIAPFTFTRASSTIDVSANTFVTYASGAPALTAEGLAVRPARDQLLEYAQDMSQAAFNIPTNATVASDGTGPLGTTSWILANTGATGTHSIRQSEAAVDLTPHSVVFTWSPGGTSTASIGMGSGFGTGMIANFTTTGGTTSKAEITSLGTVALPNGRYLSWATATPINTANSSQYIYVKNSSSYAGSSESIKIESFEFYKGDAPVFPILTPGTSTVSRAADVLYYDTTGANHTVGARFVTNAMRSPTGFRLLLGTASNHIAILQSAGKLVARAVVSGSIVATSTGPDVTSDDEVAFTYSEATKAFAWAVNGIMQTGFNNGPTGLSRVYVGSDAAGANQVNGKVAWLEVGEGLTSKLISGTGGADEESGAAIFDTTQVVVIPSATEVIVGHHLPGGKNDDWLWRSWDYREQAALRVVGWARGRIFHAKRTGATSYGPIIKQVVNTNTANDDSWKVNGAAANEFNAIMNAPSQHGFVEATAITFSLDGFEFDPATAEPAVGGRFKAEQNCIALNPLTCLRDGSAVQFDTTGKFADWKMEWIVTAKDQLLFTPTKTQTTDLTFTNASYLNMAQLVNDDTVWQTAFAREGITTISAGGSVDFTTAQPSVRHYGDEYECRFDWLSGFVGTAKIFIKNSGGSSAIHKIYAQYKTDSTFTITAGTVITSTFQEQFNLR